MTSIFETDTKVDQLADTAVIRTKELMAQSDKLRDRRERANRKRVARLFKDPKAIEATIGLFSHALWDLWHLATQKRYVPWWYAGACVYVDLAAVPLILINA
jgi:hypothetical protein